MTYRPKYFALTELVDPAIFKARGERAWESLQPAALQTLDQLRDVFGSFVVNNWNIGGQYKESGLRRFDDDTGAVYSMHKYGGAFDCKFKQTEKEVFDFILAHPTRFPLITCLENVEKTPTWLHFDVRNHDKPGIWVVNP